MYSSVTRMSMKIERITEIGVAVPNLEQATQLLVNVLGAEAHPWVITAAVAWIGVVTAAFCLVPLRLGLRNLERAEF